MAVLCEVDYQTAEQYRSKTLSVKLGYKKQKVYLKVLCDDLTLVDAVELARESPAVLAVGYRGLDTTQEYLSLKESGVYIYRLYDFGDNITESDILRVMGDTPIGVVPVINFVGGFSDLKFLEEICKKYDRVRFCGGRLFCLGSLRLGVVGRDMLEGLGCRSLPYSMYNSQDILELTDISQLEIEAEEVKQKARGRKAVKQSESRKVSEPKKTKTKSSTGKVSFSSMLSSKDFQGI